MPDILWISAGLPKAQHDGMARFIDAVVPETGLEEALALSGISLATELTLSVRATKFRRALRCFQALAAGATSIAAFREFPAWAAHLSEATPLENAPGSYLPTSRRQHVVCAKF